MRGPSEWSEGERELMGAFVSRLNTCRFCVGIHQGITTLMGGAEYVERLDNWSEAELDPRIKATFHLLEKLTSAPEDVAAPDIARVRTAGLSDDAITDAIYVSFLFATINRIANALDFDWESDADRLKLAAGFNRIVTTCASSYSTESHGGCEVSPMADESKAVGWSRRRGKP